MFDLSAINFIDDTSRKNNYSFVGLQHNAKSGKIDFYLPIGFEEFPRDSFEATKELFLGLYKIFKKFQKNKIKNRDGNINAQGGFEFQSEDNETIVLYSKINMFDTILDEFDEMEIYAFDVKRTSSDYIDFGKLDRHIDRAWFLEDDIIYLDGMEIQKDVLAFTTAELIEMFCYIYTDIKKALDDDEDIAEHIISLGTNFKEKHLTYDSSLFDEDSFEITRDILKERLDIIDKKSQLKDSVYDKYYEAIYTFLYDNPFFEGDDDIYWGIDNFAFVWEEMGHYYFFKNFKDKILFADIDRFETTDIGGKKCYKRDGFEYPFVLNYEEQNKYLYPDLVLKSCFLKHYSKDEYPEDDKLYLIENSYTIYGSRYNYRVENIIKLCQYRFVDWYYDLYGTKYYYYTIFKQGKKIESIQNNDEFAKENSRFSKEHYKQGVKEVIAQMIRETIQLLYGKRCNLKDKDDLLGMTSLELECVIKEKLGIKAIFCDFIIEKIKILEKIQSLITTDQYIIDFKYLSLYTLQMDESIEEKMKIQNDIKKQKLYQLAFQSEDDKSIVENRFYIPSFSIETDKASIENIHNTNIDVLYLNFKDAQKSYLEYSYE